MTSHTNDGSPGGAPGNGERPLSFYDNLSSAASLAGGRTIQFPDIQFRFDESIPDRRSVHSTAKSDFFGLSPAAPAPIHSTTSPLTLNEPRATPGSAPATPPLRPYDAGASTSSPASSGASTAPLESPSVSPSSAREADSEPATSTPRCSRPSSTIKTITIKLPDPAGCGTPSEAVYMTTTVPQNFAKNANTLIGRHKPTRSSLRHSRMLVVNKAVPVRYPPGNSLNLRHLRLCRTLMVLEILIGVVLNVIGLGIMVWSPSTSTKDNPYWSGLILIVCGVLFLVLFQFKRARSGTDKGIAQNVARLHQQQSPWRENCFHFLRMNALVVLLLTIFFTALAFIYALIHATYLSAEALRCEPQFTFNVNSSTCVCTIDTRLVGRTTVSPMVPNATDSPLDGGSAESLSSDDGIIRLEYRYGPRLLPDKSLAQEPSAAVDFNCNEVHSIWYYVMIVSTLLNSAGCLLATTFLVIYSIECIRRSTDRQPHRAKNGQSSGARIADPTTVLNHQQTATPNASTMPLLPVAKPTPDTSILSGNSASRPEAGQTDTTFSMEETTLTTILSDELGGGDEGNKALKA
uniref:Uncharacterized protein n=1 Tax=Anopheles epiroticus TaxID=199890 RepID=A0A182PL42_9DIPT